MDEEEENVHNLILVDALYMFCTYLHVPLTKYLIGMLFLLSGSGSC